ncbi:MAG: hypothetical protein HC802_04390 [Caldilineaceae bacterium]|nr:hypothetical protein [Caldilineaceae bacterium]
MFAFCIGLVLMVVAQGAEPALAADEEIVYIDAAGVIRVLDTHRTSGRPLVEWFSPEGDWRSFGLGDFNNDGDYEIVAVGGEGFNGKLTVYDPVVAKEGEDNARINGVPWETLYTTTFAGRPTLVETGDFATDVAGDEIVYGYELNETEKNNTGDNYRMVVLRATNAQSPTGREWSTLVPGRDSVEKWSRIAAGNFDNRAPDNIVVIDEELGDMHLLYIDGNRLLSLLEHDDNNTAKWRDAAFGQFVDGGLEEMAATRYAPLNLASYYVLNYDQNDGSVDDVVWEIFDPSPRVVFMGDVNGSGDDEVLLLRNVPPEVGDRPRLILRNNGNDSVIPFEVPLDADNGYRTGASGDADGNGKDDVVVMRSNNAAVYLDVAVGTTRNDYAISSDRRNVALADLDRNGFEVVALLNAEPDPLVATIKLRDGEDSFGIALTNAGTGDQIPFSASVVEGQSWATLAQASGTTPATVTVTIDVTNLTPGEHEGEIEVMSSNPDVANQPLSISIQLTVEATIQTNPVASSFDFFPCDDSMTPITQTVTVDGPSGMNFEVQVADDWISSNPSTGSVPATIGLVVDPSKRSADYDSTILRFLADSTGDGVKELQGVSQVNLACVNGRAYLPLIMR